MPGGKPCADVDAGYAERRGCPTDRRSVYVSLTAAGVAKVDEATAAHRWGLHRHLLGPARAERARHARRRASQAAPLLSAPST